MSNIDDLIAEFKSDAANKGIPPVEIVRKYITFGVPYVFGENQYKYYGLKSKLAARFDVNPNHVHMVGSAKLGFSLAPYQLWKRFDDESDIDMVIISEPLFMKFWKELHEFNISTTPRTEAENTMYQKFLKYFFKGWLRPDLFPFNYPGKEEWFRFFQSVSYREYERKVTGAIYMNDYFFEYYHTLNIQSLRDGGNL